MTRFFLIVLNDFLMIASDKLSRKSKTMEKEKEGVVGHNLTHKKKYLEKKIEIYKMHNFSTGQTFL